MFRFLNKKYFLAPEVLQIHFLIVVPIFEAQWQQKRSNIHFKIVLGKPRQDSLPCCSAYQTKPDPRTFPNHFDTF